MPRTAIVLLCLTVAAPALAQDGWAVFANDGKVYRVRVGQSPEQLHSGSAAHAVWSATGEYVYFIETDGDIWRMANDGSATAKVTNGTTTAYNPLAAFRPDDDYVLYVEGNELYKVNGSSGARTLLQDEPRNYVGEIGISASGNRIAARGSDSNLYWMEVGSSSQQYATTCSASISPDGTLLTANVDGHTELTIHNSNGSVHKTLHAPTGQQWDNQKFAVNSNDYVVYKHDNVGAIGINHVPTDTNTRLADIGSDYPDFFLGNLPAPPSDPPPDDPPDDPPPDDPPDDPPPDDPPPDDAPLDPNLIILEAEDMSLVGYEIEDTIIATMETGTASGSFPGEAGSYRLEVTIVKENDGEPWVDVLLNGDLVQRIQYPLGSDSRDPETVDLGMLALEPGDAISLDGVRVDGAAARLDRVTFTSGVTDDPVDPPVEPQPDLPDGYFVWSRGELGDSASRRIYRMTLPGREEVQPITGGEDVGGQISPDGRWVAYAKARLPGGTDYHDFALWSVYIVSIHGVDAGNIEIEIDEEGYWPSWGGIDELYYSKTDGQHTHIMRVTIDEDGNITSSETFFSTRDAFGDIPEINECFVAPDGAWFAGRTRGNDQPGVGAYNVDPAEFHRLGWTGSSGCMPYVAPSGTWGFHAGNSAGVRWGDAPWIPDRQINQQLVAAKPGGMCYHPGISSDEQWFMTGHSQDSRQNDGAWDIYIYRLAGKTASDEQLLVAGGFNGWPHVFVFDSSLPTDDPGGDDPGDDPGGDDPDSTDELATRELGLIAVASCSGADGGWLGVMVVLGLLARRRRGG